MKTAVILVILCILPVTVFAESMQIANLPNGAQYLADRFVVTMRSGVPTLEVNKARAGAAISGVNSIDYLCTQQNVTQIEPWYPGIIKHPDLAELVNRMYIFHVASGTNVIAARDAFRTSPDIECADLYDIPALCYVPNDPQHGVQWHLTNIQAYQAWDLFRGDTTRTAIVSIVDTGVYFRHLDLIGNIWINSEEDINHDGQFTSDDNNGIDDDGNGYIDDVVGWDFGRGDNDPSEEYAIHGTHVAGCASEDTDNNRNGAGIGFHVRIMPVKGARWDTLTSVYQGFAYAADNGANVINCSWGSPSPSQAYQNLINTIWNDGVVIVAAAGNNGNTQLFYPAAYANVLSVIATTSSDHKAGFSSYGSWCDVCAPGQGIYSTWSTGSFLSLDGTSMASPITAGLAGLIKAAHPSWSNQDIVNDIINSADNIDDLNPGYRGLLGSGRINAFSALGAGSYPLIVIDTTQVSIINDDGDHLINPGESFSMVMTLSNLWADALNVTATISGTGFDISDSTASFGNLAHGQQGDNSSHPFQLTAHTNLVPGDQEIYVHITADSGYVKDDTIMVNVSLYQVGFPKDIPGNIESSPIIYDFDNDGSNEIVFGANDRNIYALEADGSNSPGWPQAVNNDAAAGPAIGDIDHDGGNEIVAISKSGQFSAWHANGTAVTGFPVDKGGLFYSSPLLADLDGDQRLEIIAGSFTDNRVYVIKYDGSDLTGWPTPALNRWYGSPSAGDIDEDGLDEIVYAGFDSSLHVWNADGTEVSGFPTRLNGQVRSAPSIGDVDGDSHLEIAVTVYTTGDLYLIDHTGQVMSGFPVHISPSLSSTPSLVDINGDGNLEIILGSSDGNLCAFNVSGHEITGYPIPISGSVFGTAAVGDITGDGLPDIIVGTYSGNLYGFDRTGATLNHFPIMGTGSRPISGSVAIGDLDNDGRMEIVVPIKAIGSNLVVYDYRVQASTQFLKWPNFGRDSYRRNNSETPLVGVLENDASVPNTFSLSQNYPNPFNNSTTISFSLSRNGNVSLMIYDLLGRRVKLLQSGNLSTGKHSFTWNGTDESGAEVTSGVYFYRLESREGVSTRRMVLLK
jgi:serine protease